MVGKNVKTGQNMMKILTVEEMAEIYQKKRPLDDLDVIQSVEGILKKKKGNAFVLPVEGTSVILLLSGGSDSVGMMFLLALKFHLRVYPLFIRRGQKRVKQEEKAARFYVNLLRLKKPGSCAELFVLDQTIPPEKIRWYLTQRSNEKVKRSGQKNQQARGIPAYLGALSAVAVQYGMYLEIKEGALVRDIFCGFVVGDGRVMSYETLTAIRTTTLQLGVLQNDYRWQITSLALEKELGYFWNKSDIMSWCEKKKIDMSRTWSCYYANKYHCGACVGCLERQKHFKLAGVKDLTVYKKRSFSEVLLNKFMEKINYEKYHEFYF